MRSNLLDFWNVSQLFDIDANLTVNREGIEGQATRVRHVEANPGATLEHGLASRAEFKSDVSRLTLQQMRQQQA